MSKPRILLLALFFVATETLGAELVTTARHRLSSAPGIVELLELGSRRETSLDGRYRTE